MAEKRKVNILIVDDHIDSLVALEAVLDQPNYNIVKATSGEEALRQLLKTDFALVLLDVQMPQLNGFEIARLIRQREKNRAIPIIFITGFGKEEKHIAEGYSTGAVDYLLKPVDPEILKAKVEFFTNLYLKNEAMKETGYKYKELLDGVKAVLWRAEPRSFNFTFVTKEAESLTGYALEDWLQKGFWKNIIHPEDRERIMMECEQALDEKISREIEYRMLLKDGSVKWFQNLLHVVTEQEEVKELVGIMVDVTERKEVEEAIRKANDALESRVLERTADLARANLWLRNLIANIPGAVYRCRCDAGWPAEFMSESIHDISGYAASDFLENRVRSFSSIVHPEDLARIQRRVIDLLSTQRPYDLEYRILHADGGIRWVQDRGQGVFESGHLLYMDGVVLDISERRKAEESIKASLQEKEVLLREIHHRVKNNLQIISSLLNLQRAYSKAPETAEILNECQNRVRSMALIHEKLYETEDLARIDFASYIHDLTSYLFRSYGVATSVKRRIDSANVLFNIDTAIPCGLIIHELVSNALKHAFPDGKSGEVEIRLAENSGKYLLTVSDNGVGFPTGVDFRSVESLGMKLITTLTGQLGGTVEMENQHGTTFRIAFSQVRSEARSERPVPV